MPRKSIHASQAALGSLRWLPCVSPCFFLDYKDPVGETASRFRLRVAGVFQTVSFQSLKRAQNQAFAIQPPPGGE